MDHKDITNHNPTRRARRTFLRSAAIAAGMAFLPGVPGAKGQDGQSTETVQQQWTAYVRKRIKQVPFPLDLWDRSPSLEVALQGAVGTLEADDKLRADANDIPFSHHLLVINAVHQRLRDGTLLNELPDEIKQYLQAFAMAMGKEPGSKHEPPVGDYNCDTHTCLLFSRGGWVVALGANPKFEKKHDSRKPGAYFAEVNPAGFLKGEGRYSVADLYDEAREHIDSRCGVTVSSREL